MNEPTALQTELDKIAAALRSLETVLTGPALEAARKPLLERRAALLQTGNLQAGQDINLAGGDLIQGQTVVVVKDNGTLIYGEEPVRVTSFDPQSAPGRYLAHLIARNRYLQLQGIRAGGRLVNIELEQAYVTLRTTQTRGQIADRLAAEDRWLAAEAHLAPGESLRRPAEALTETVVVAIQEALARHRRLVILGDPGSGKTTLLRYLALNYARDRAERSARVKERLGLDEAGYLPLLLPLRALGAYLHKHAPHETGDGHALLLRFLLEYLRAERLDLGARFFDPDLLAGRAVILLDGMDEVGDADLRRRVARLIESFACAYPGCRVVVTSRIVGYTGPARLGESFSVTTVRDFTLQDVERFLQQWHRLTALGLLGPGESSEQYAAEQTRLLLDAVRANPRLRELAINPLMLTVIALVHRERVKLPDRRAELYAEAVDVLLGKWDEARGVQEIAVLDDRPFELADKRQLLQRLALSMHEAQQKEIPAEDLRRWLAEYFAGLLSGRTGVRRAVDRFLTVIQERTGLLVAAGPQAYRFSHLTFQEYLAAVEAAERDDYVEYVLQHLAEPFWREAILLVAGYLSTKKVAKAARLVRAIAACRQEPEPFHNFVLAAECLRDVGAGRVEGDLVGEMRQTLQNELETPLPKRPTGKGIEKWLAGATKTEERRRAFYLRRMAAASALGRIESGSYGAGGQYWSPPYGEPKWVPIPAGEFWMGSEEHNNEKPLHRLFLPEYSLAITPVTNAQYALYVIATGARPPKDWNGDLPEKGLERHPVVYVSWHETVGYCRWLSQATGKRVRLPSEAEWEKAARGQNDRRRYPWGDEFDASRCNTKESGIGKTTPVGMYPTGASPYGCLDMSGNVWEWTRSLWGNDWNKPDYPYPNTNRQAEHENLRMPDDVARVVRGGSFGYVSRNARCAFRDWGLPGDIDWNIGFRVCISPSTKDDISEL